MLVKHPMTQKKMMMMKMRKRLLILKMSSLYGIQKVDKENGLRKLVLQIVLTLRMKLVGNC
jgi:hypothetical protein